MKTLLVTFSLLFFSIRSFSQKGTISGVVTYFYNYYQGDRPDIGSQVYIFNDSTAYQNDLKIIDSFYHVKLNRSLFATYSDSLDVYNGLLRAAKYKGKKKRESETETYSLLKMSVQNLQKSYQDELTRYNAETNAKFLELDKRAWEAKTKLIASGWIAKKTVDGAGNYSFELNPDTYLVLIISNGREGISLTEISGKLYVSDIIHLSGNNTVDVSHKFDLN